MVRPAIRHLASAFRLPPSFLDPLRDHVLVGSGLPAQLRWLTRERLIEFSHGRALEDPGDLGQRLGLAPPASSRSPATAALSSSPVSLRHFRVMPRLTSNSSDSLAEDIRHADSAPAPPTQEMPVMSS